MSSLSKYAAVLALFFIAGPVVTGKHPVEFVHDVLNRPGDMFAGDPNKGLTVPPLAPATWSGKERRASYFKFYDDFTQQVARETPLGDTCGRVDPAPGTLAYVADVAEGSTPLRGPHWENLPSFTTVVKVTVAPADHGKLLYLRSVNRVLWNIEGKPAGVYLHGKSHLGRIDAGVPVHSARHAKECDWRNGLPRDIAKRMKHEGDMIAMGGMPGSGSATSMGGMLAALEEQARSKNRAVVEHTSGAPIKELLISTRAKQIGF